MLDRRLVLAGIAGLAAVFAVLARAAAPGPAFPVTLAAANGKVTLAAQPKRIVSLSPTATEDLFAIGAGSQVVAVDDQSDYPKNAPRTKLSGYTPSAEAIISYHPDLVVLSYDPNRVVNALGKAKVPVLMEPGAKTLGDAYAQIGELGAATGHAAGARALVARMRSRIAALVRAAPHPAHPLSVYHELEPDYYTATSKTFIGRIYSLFGLRNIADAADKSGSGYPQLSAEYIVSSDPDLIVLADTRCCGQTPASVAARPGWGGMQAVRRHAIVRIDDSIASRWGPRIVDFVRAVSSALRVTA